MIKKVTDFFIISTCLTTSLAFASLDKASSDGFIKAGKGRLFYQTVGKGEPIIALHGGPGLDHGYLLPQLADAVTGHAITFFDQRGSGRSDGFLLTDEFINAATFVEDVDAVRSMLGAKKVILLGHSWGAVLALQYAIDHPDHVDKLILLNSGPVSAAGYGEFFIEYQKRTQPIKSKMEAIQNSAAFKKQEAKAINDFYRVLFSVYFPHPTDASLLSLNITAESGFGGMKVNSLLGASYIAKFDLRESLKKIKIPTLIIHGDHDIVPINLAKEIADHIPGAKFEIIKDSGHFSFVDHTKETKQSLNTFLSLYSR